MTPVLWRRRIKATQDHGEVLSRMTGDSERKVRRSTERLELASSRAERAAVAILARDDDLLKAAARRS